MSYIKKYNGQFYIETFDAADTNESIEVPLKMCIKRGTNEILKDYLLLPGEIIFDKIEGYLYINNNSSSIKTSELEPINFGFDMVKAEYKLLKHISQINTIDNTSQMVFKYLTPSEDKGVLYYITIEDFKNFLQNNLDLSANQITSGVLSIPRGGTGASTQKAAEYNLLNNMNETSETVENNYNIVFRYSTPSETSGVLYYAKASSILTYIEKNTNFSNITTGTVSLENLPIISIAKGGTNATTAKAAQYNLLNDMNEITTAIKDTTNFVFKYASPSSTNGTIYYKQASTVSAYINSKLPISSTSTSGIVKVGNNITVSSGIISLTNTNITNALGYVPPNMTFNSGSGYLQFGNYKICWGTFTTPKYTANLFQDVAISGVNFASSFSSVPTVFFQSNAYQGVIDIQPNTVTTSGITSVRIHRHTATGSQVDGVTLSYIAIGPA